MSTKKISQLSAALGVDITPSTDVIIINDGGTTKKITVNELLSNLDSITATGTISSSLTTEGSFGIIANSASFNYVTASHLDLDAETLSIGGTPFSKAELDNLKAGKTITTSANRVATRVKQSGTLSKYKQIQPKNVQLTNINKLDALVNSADNTTFIQTNDAGTFNFVVSNTSSFLINSNSVDVNLPVFLPSITGSTSFTGSTEFSGSTTVSGSFTVTDLLTVLADFGQTGSFGVSGSSTFQGDVNMDGNVDVQDLLTILAGFNASGDSTNSGSFANTGSFTNSGSFANDGTGSFTGSFDVSGSFTGEGTGSFTGSFDVSGSFTGEGTGSFTGSFDISGSGRFTSNDINFDLNSIPTTDPNVAGQLWRSGTDLKISIG